MTNEMTFDRGKLHALKAAYNRAIKAGKSRDDAFGFDGQLLIVGYAKYLIEYLETKLGGSNG